MATPFLIYLTVFKSRLGLGTIILDLTGFAHQPEQALLRRVRGVLEQRDDLRVSDPANDFVFEYLRDKRLVGGNARASGRYAGFALERLDGGFVVSDRNGESAETLPTYMTDIWMADPRLRSTIGVPTPENAGETLELALQLGLLTKGKNTWTAAGQLVHALRHDFGRRDGATKNPFLLRADGIGLLRQVIETDGILMREMLRALVTVGGRVRRDDVARNFEAIVASALSAAADLGVRPTALRVGRDFLNQVRKSAAGSGGSRRNSNRAKVGPSQGPGVLEHRVSPRLEWLTDLGYLAKDHLPKNGFEYEVASSAEELLRDMDAHIGRERWADEVAVSQWHSGSAWASVRSDANVEPQLSFLDAYTVMRRRIGPAPLREVAFVAAIGAPRQQTFASVVEGLIAFAQDTDGSSLSGGRLRRSPENIYISDAALARADA